MASTTRAPSASRNDGSRGGLIDRMFEITARGSSIARETVGGLTTFMAMAYIVVLNPIILASGADKNGHHLALPQLITATALVAGVTTILMAVVGNVPLAIASGLGLDAFVAFQIAPKMSWPDAMGLVVLEGALICLAVIFGLRQAIMHAMPRELRYAIGAGIGALLFFIGLGDGGFISAPQGGALLQLGKTGELSGWPVAIFAFGVVLSLLLIMWRVWGGLLIAIILTTVAAIIVRNTANVPDKAWNLVVPKWPHHVTGSPDFGLIGHVSVFGAFAAVGVMPAVILLLTIALSDFFDAMGTTVSVTEQAGILEADGVPPRLGRILFVDGLAAMAGGAGSASSNTMFIESSAGVGAGARTGFANLVTGAMFLIALVFTPLIAVVPSEAAAPALIVVAFYMFTPLVRSVPWSTLDHDQTFAILAPVVVTVLLMPATYSITNGIAGGVITYLVVAVAQRRWRQIHPLMWGIGALFAAYFLLHPIKEALNIS